MLNFYQHIPEYLNPIIFSVGFFDFRWYSLGYGAALLITTLLLHQRIKKSEFFQEKNNFEKNWNLSIDILSVGVLGMLLGGRLGYVFFYDWKFFQENPISIIWPFDWQTGEYVGIFGMSYFGALLGVVFFSGIFLKIKKIDFWKTADFFVPTIAAGYFFGRIGNFFNGELFGRKTEFFLGMYFQNESFLRHPSQLYEALGEGLLLFIFLWFIRNKGKFDGQIFLIYVMGYCLIRFFLEYLRAFDWQLEIFWIKLTLGQFMAIFFFVGAFYFYFQRKNKSAIILK